MNNLTKAVLMKAGQSIKDITQDGDLYRNIIKTKHMFANITHMLPGSKSPVFNHEGEEIKLLIKGELEYHVGSQKFLMQAGDVLFHESSEKHWARNKGPYEAVFITISAPPTFTLFKE